jgi:hypothetical protein
MVFSGTRADDADDLHHQSAKALAEFMTRVELVDAAR